MGNTSKKYRNKKLTTWGLILFAVVIIGSFIISRSSQEVDPASFADVETFELSSHILGNPEADITLLEYSDFQCPACAQAYPAVKQFVENYGSQFSFEYRHFPLRNIHPNAQLAAQAAEAAAVQGKFWEMHDMLFEGQAEWSQSINPKKVFKKYAEAIGINTDRFMYDLESEEVKARVDAQAQEAELLALPGTPSFIVNGQVADFQSFVNLIDLEAIDTPQA